MILEKDLRKKGKPYNSAAYYLEKVSKPQHRKGYRSRDQQSHLDEEIDMEVQEGKTAKICRTEHQGWRSCTETV